MPVEITNWMLTAYHALNRSWGFMVWNTFLAVIPWVMSLLIFKERGTKRRHVGWWIGFVIFVAFLPNAPYVLTDVIHLVRFIREGAAMWTVVFVLMPQYFLFMLVGSQAYVLSLMNLGQYLRKQGLSGWVSVAEISFHGLCAFGIYLGRVPRFNSWDLISNPGQIVRFIAQDVWQPQPLAVMLMTFLAIALIYWPLKHLTLAVMLYGRSPKNQQPFAKP